MNESSSTVPRDIFVPALKLLGECFQEQKDLQAKVDDDHTFARIMTVGLFTGINATSSITLEIIRGWVNENWEQNPLSQEFSTAVFARKVDITDNGQPKISDLEPRFRANTLFALSAASQLYGIESPRFTDTELYPQFLDAIKIRNNLVHPTRPEHLDVSDSQFETVTEGFAWYTLCYRQLVPDDEFRRYFKGYKRPAVAPL